MIKIYYNKFLSISRMGENLFFRNGIKLGIFFGKLVDLGFVLKYFRLFFFFVCIYLFFDL